MAIRERTFGDAFREARLAAGMTQEEVARDIGVTLKTAQAWDTGKKEPRLEHYVAICRLFGWALPPYLVSPKRQRVTPS